MAIAETTRTTIQLRKLSALRKSVGNDLGEEVFMKWLARQANPKDKADPSAVKIVETLAGLENDPKLRPRRSWLHNTSGEKQRRVGLLRIQE